MSPNPEAMTDTASSLPNFSRLVRQSESLREQIETTQASLEQAAEDLLTTSVTRVRPVLSPLSSFLRILPRQANPLERLTELCSRAKDLIKEAEALDIDFYTQAVHSINENSQLRHDIINHPRGHGGLIRRSWDLYRYKHRSCTLTAMPNRGSGEERETTVRSIILEHYQSDAASSDVWREWQDLRANTRILRQTLETLRSPSRSEGGHAELSEIARYRSEMYASLADTRADPDLDELNAGQTAILRAAGEILRGSGRAGDEADQDDRNSRNDNGEARRMEDAQRGEADLAKEYLKLCHLLGHDTGHLGFSRRGTFGGTIIGKLGGDTIDEMRET